MNEDRSILFQRALAQLLPSLAAGMVDHGVRLQVAHDHLKRALVDAAISREDTDISDSRVSLLTGVHRKDVKRLRDIDAPKDPVAMNPIALIVTEWRNAHDRTVTREKFAEIVRATRVDLAPGTIREEMMRLNLIIDDGNLTLNVDALVAPAGSDEIYSIFARNLASHMNVAISNLSANDPQYERAARFSNLSPASIEILENLAAEIAQKALVDFADKAAELQKIDRDFSENTSRIAFGAFVEAKDKSS